MVNYPPSYLQSRDLLIGFGAPLVMLLVLACWLWRSGRKSTPIDGLWWSGGMLVGSWLTEQLSWSLQVYLGAFAFAPAADDRGLYLSMQFLALLLWTTGLLITVIRVLRQQSTILRGLAAFGKTFALFMAPLVLTGAIFPSSMDTLSRFGARSADKIS